MAANAIFDWILRASYTGRRELTLALGTRRGRVLAYALLLCAALPSGIRVWMESRAALGAQPQRQVASITTLYGSDVAGNLSTYPPAMVSLCILTLMAIPLIMLIAGHDSISRDVADRLMRSAVLRTSDGSIVTGKFVGLWLTLATILMLCQLLVGVAVALLTRYPVSDAFQACVRLWLACALSSAPYAALALLTSAVVASSGRSLVVGFTAIVALVFIRINHVFSPELASWLLPSQNDARLLSSSWQGVASAAFRLGVWTTVALVLCTATLRRREL